jgi:hypothetical protein
MKSDMQQFYKILQKAASANELCSRVIILKLIIRQLVKKRH